MDEVRESTAQMILMDVQSTLVSSIDQWCNSPGVDYICHRPRPADRASEQGRANTIAGQKRRREREKEEAR